MNVDVFISYHTNSSLHIVEAIVNKLESVDLCCWYPPRNLMGDFNASICKAISDCKIFLLILNKAASKSQHVLYELDIASKRLAKKENIVILPICVESVDSDIIDYYIGNLQRIFIDNPPNINQIDEICEKVKDILKAENADLQGHTKEKADLKMPSSDNVKGSSSMRYAFISYSSKNQQMADSFRTLFNQNGIKTWMAPGDIPFGSTYTATINRAIKDSSCFVLLLSESAQGSRWVLNETERAVSTGKTIFTVLLDDVAMNDDFEIMLSTSQAVAIRKIDESDEKIKQLVAAIKAYLLL